MAHRHPWETSRQRFFRRVLRKTGINRSATSVLDVGAGDAWLSWTLLPVMPQARITCLDDAYTPEWIAKNAARFGSRMRFVAARPAERFDLVIALDVLEHVDDDEALLAELARENLAPDGRMLLSVPAWPLLFGAHDEDLHHRRRYRPRGMQALLGRCGLEAVEKGGLFHSLLVLRVLEIAAARAGLLRAPPPDAGDWKGGALVTKIIDGALAMDGAVSTSAAKLGLELPGLSWWALCRKRR
jgi:2-polyprenyl-3-methyl-5-hydroxy-6-metoxy-1,4-benzoquinol methylase